MELATTREFNGVTLNCYVEQQDSNDFWATREQIGQALGYATPGISIGKMHERHKDRLDKFSRVSQIDLPSGGVQEVFIYNFKGLLEICRYSNQPVADKVIDVLWDIADEIRRTGSYNAQSELSALAVRAAEVLKDTDRKQFKGEIYRLVTGHDLPEPERKAKPEHTPRRWTATHIGRTLKWSADAVMHRAENLGIGHWDGETWSFDKDERRKFLELVGRGVERIADGYEYYDGGYKRIHWSFKA